MSDDLRGIKSELEDQDQRLRTIQRRLETLHEDVEGVRSSIREMQVTADGRDQSYRMLLDTVNRFVKAQEAQQTATQALDQAVRSISQLLQGAFGDAGLVEGVKTLWKTMDEVRDKLNRGEILQQGIKAEVDTIKSVQNKMDQHMRALDETALVPKTVGGDRDQDARWAKLTDLAIKLIVVLLGMVAASVFGFKINGLSVDDSGVHLQPISIPATSAVTR